MDHQVQASSTVDWTFWCDESFGAFIIIDDKRNAMNQYPHIAIMVDTSGIPHGLFLSIRDEVRKSVEYKFPRYRGRVLVEGSPGVITVTAYDARGERVSWLERDCEWIAENKTFDVLSSHHDYEGFYWDQKIDGWKESM